MIVSTEKVLPHVLGTLKEAIQVGSTVPSNSMPVEEAMFIDALVPLAEGTYSK